MDTKSLKFEVTYTILGLIIPHLTTTSQRSLHAVCRGRAEAEYMSNRFSIISMVPTHWTKKKTRIFGGIIEKKAGKIGFLGPSRKY